METTTGGLTSNSVNLLLGQASSNPSSMSTKTVPQQVDIVQRIIELLLQVRIIHLKIEVKWENIRKHMGKCFLNTGISL